MKRRTVEEITERKSIEVLLEKALAVLEADDGKTSEEKREAVISILCQKDKSDLAEQMIKRMIDEDHGQKLCDRFWESGEIIRVGRDITLQKVCDAHREDFLEVRLQYSALKSFMKMDAYRAMLWNGHTRRVTLMFSIFQNGEYVGYCGIHNVTREKWEVAIELFPQKTKQGIGTLAITAMLDEIKKRLGKTEYRVRIEPANVASQKLFEKLGAVPNGIGEAAVHDPKLIQECEEENLQHIDEELIAVAKKFSVEPRKLLSHVLEYSLQW